MFGSMKSDKSKNSVISAQHIEENFGNRNSFQKKGEKEEVNFSMFGSMKSGDL